MAKTVSATLGNESDTTLLCAYPAVAMWKVSSGSLVPLYSFYDTGDTTTTWAADPSSTSGSEATNYEITAGDGTVVQFPKNTRRIDGTDGTLVTTSSTSDGNFSNVGTMQFTAQFAPKAYGGSSFAKQTWSSFINQLTQGTTPVRDMELLVAMPTGQTYTDINTNNTGTGQVDGWIFMFGKINSDITVAAGSANPTNLQITLASYRPHGIDAEDIGGMTAIALLVPDGTQTGITVTTPSLSSDDAAVLLAGKILLKAN
ncbi:MAG: hypothetical protein IJK61_03705 [Bacteroidetes bacterium]|nr:hypothetical protein [Bacteroidota bacterium]